MLTITREHLRNLAHCRDLLLYVRTRDFLLSFLLEHQEGNADEKRAAFVLHRENVEDLEKIDAFLLTLNPSRVP